MTGNLDSPLSDIIINLNNEAKGKSLYACMNTHSCKHEYADIDEYDFITI
jgi:hypothetical protein